MLAASELRTGTVIRFEGSPCLVLVPRENGGVVHADLRDISSGRSWRQRFPKDLQLEEVAIERRDVSYLYEATDQYWCMDTRTFEQIGLPAGLIGRRRAFLQEGMTLSVEFVDGCPVSVTFQRVVEASIKTTLSPDHYQSAYKRAILDNGVEVTVPSFLESGVRISLDLDTLTCVSPRHSGDK